MQAEEYKRIKRDRLTEKEKIEKEGEGNGRKKRGKRKGGGNWKGEETAQGTRKAYENNTVAVVTYLCMEK